MAEQPAVVPVAGTPLLLLGQYSLAAQGYAEREFFVSGDALSYRAGWDAAGDPIGRPWGRHRYKTRIVVLTPARKRFNGTVVVEWLNVTNQVDVPVDWITLHRELLRRGYAYVAVSAQQMGVEGDGMPDGVLGPPLKLADPARYASLSLPGDAYSFGIFSDIGRILKDQPATVLGDLQPRRLLAVGESQSAIYLTTYINFVDPLDRIYDGYLIHSRAGGAAGLDWSTLYSASEREKAQPIRLRRNLRVPVLQLITETELTGLVGFVGYAAARQPDTAHLRTWEIAGTAHVDNYLMGGGMIDIKDPPTPAFAASCAPMRRFGGMVVAQPINNAPQHHYVAEAALAWLNKWVASGTAPPHAAPIELNAGSPPTLRHDADGNALGGIRTPWVEVPTSTLSGIGEMGSVSPFSPAKLARLYPGGRAEYMRDFTAALDRTITAGFILPADRAEILTLAATNYPAGAD